MTNFHHTPRPWWRQLLRPLGWLYGSGAALHRWWHQSGGGGQYVGPPLVIAVGNLSVGGTGKTPHVVYLYRLLAAEQSLAVVSRGYGRHSRGLQVVRPDATAQQVGDEPLLLQQLLPQALVVVAAQRAAGIERALEERPQVGVVLLDDALQHWAVRPDVAILLTTFDAPFFEDAVLPVGRLREFGRGYQRAHIIIVTKCPDALSLAQRQAFSRALRPLPHQLVVFSRYAYGLPYALGAFAQPLSTWEQWAEASILVVAALARTQYLETFVQEQVQAAELHSYPDHYFYTETDLRHIARQAQGRPVWITEKDAVKWVAFATLLQDLQLAVYVLPIQVVLSPSDEADLLARLRQASYQKKRPPAKS